MVLPDYFSTHFIRNDLSEGDISSDTILVELTNLG